MSDSAAVPADLAEYSRRAQELDRQLAEDAQQLHAALQAFRDTHPDYGGNLAEIERRVLALAAECGELDAWVGRVGDAFQRADDRKHMAHHEMGPYGPAAANHRVVKVKDKALGDDGDGWDLLGHLHRGNRDWASDHAPADCSGFYTGGGYLVGPDGQKYWIVIPNVWDGGRRFSGELGARALGEGPIDDLNGKDPGWTLVGMREGTVMLDHENWFTRAMAGFAASADYKPLLGKAADKEGYESLYVNPENGEPVIESHPRQPRQHPEGDAPKIGIPVQLDDGSIHWIDPYGRETPFGLPGRDLTTGKGLTAAQRENPIIRDAQGRPDTADAVPNAVGLGMLALESAVAAWELDNQDLVHYQVVFERDADGRQRAIIRAFQITSDDEGKLKIFPFHVYVDDKGRPRLEGTTFRRGAEIRSVDAAPVIDTGAT